MVFVCFCLSLFKVFSYFDKESTGVQLIWLHERRVVIFNWEFSSKSFLDFPLFFTYRETNSWNQLLLYFDEMNVIRMISMWYIVLTLCLNTITSCWWCILLPLFEDFYVVCVKIFILDDPSWCYCNYCK